MKITFKCSKYVQNDILAIKLNKFVSNKFWINEFLKPKIDGNIVKKRDKTKINLAKAWYDE